MAQGVEGNPDDLRDEELHTKAWPLIEPYFMKTQNEAANRYKDLSNTDQVTTDLEQAFLAAYQGRVELAFTVEDYQVWGHYDVDTNKVHIHTTFQTGDEDLLNLISMYTLKNGGAVFVVEPEKMPAKAPLAVILRF